MSEPNENPAPQDFAKGIKQEKIGSGGISDAVAGTDALGFDPYVKAIAAFLTNSVTIPPLTLSVEGEWGAGKSSFMRLLRNELKKEEYAREGQPLAIVEFNAWRNDKEDALWAAFAIEFLRQLAPRSWTKRVWAHLKLWRLRFDLWEGWYDVLHFVVLLLTVLVATINIYVHRHGLKDLLIALFSEKGNLVQFIFGIGGLAGSILLLFVFFRKLKEIIGNPFAIDLQKYVDKPDYKERTAFIEKFHRDFAKIVKTYLPRGRAFVFIDDLDRCEVPKAADLMQALNLLMSAESASLIFILGIDREMIAAGLAAKYESLLPYFTVSTGSPSGPIAGLEYGYAFLEKFIQLPFQVPRPRGVDVDRLLDSLGAEPVSESHGSGPQPMSPDLLEVVLEKDSPHIREIIQKIAPSLDYNPRRLKQFVNVFRLKIYIASETGLFTAPTAAGFAPLTLEKLGKFVVLSLRWPRLLTVLAGNPGWLSILQHRAWGMTSDRSETKIKNYEQMDFWLAKPRLLDLLRLPFKDDDEVVSYWQGEPKKLASLRDPIAQAWSLASLNIERLLETSPRRKERATGGSPPSESTQSPTVSGENETELVHFEESEELDVAENSRSARIKKDREQSAL